MDNEVYYSEMYEFPVIDTMQYLVADQNAAWDQFQQN